jgi:hypothetical protein
VSDPGFVARWFPWPLVTVALLLALLIVFTPLLTSSGQPAAGSIFSQAELIVDGLPGNSTTHFYVRGIGATTRYESVHLGLAYGFPWTGSFPAGRLHWTSWSNGSNVLSVAAASNALPVAVNVSALYVSGGLGVRYFGVLAFNLSSPAPGGPVSLDVVSGTGAIPGFSWLVANLPVTITLAAVNSGGGP